jgi:ribosome biogenesis GTPase
MHLDSVPTGDQACFARLLPYGWDAEIAARFAALPADGVPARVLAEYRARYDLVTPHGETVGTLGSGLRAWSARLDWPVVGDWVAVRTDPNGATATVHAVVPRRSAFVRAAATDGAPQIIAANVDTVLVVDALDRSPNLRRLERYLVLAWESGAHPLIALSKLDCAADRTAALQAVASVAAGVPVLAYSAVTGEGLAAVWAQLAPRRTVALLGPSGVGKSTLTNYLVGGARQRMGPVRGYDGKGRHTTTGRQLVLAANAALLIDTPGLRALGIGDAAQGIGQAFAEIAALAHGCRFADCQHAAEPGCAARAAIDRGDLPAMRLESYRKLTREQEHHQARGDLRAGAVAKRRLRSQMRAYNAEARRRERW